MEIHPIWGVPCDKVPAWPEATCGCPGVHHSGMWQWVGRLSCVFRTMVSLFKYRNTAMGMAVADMESNIMDEDWQEYRSLRFARLKRFSTILSTREEEILMAGDRHNLYSRPRH